ncbi:hypothetical protein [Ferruginibacter sp. SUN106]|uniref:hypothetical protein n=1 Tax=Ferruginibacter sp. SUN106 TaxID=2978348 RepID=UPI003D365966
MKHLLTFSIIVFGSITGFSQGIKKITDPLTPCGSRADVDAMPGIYTDHNNTKYGFALKGTTAEKAAMMKNLITVEKSEEASRKDFTLTGCVARVSFTRWGSSNYGKNVYAYYGYSMSVYALVCNIVQHASKIVDEYRTTFRVDFNPSIMPGGVHAVGTGEFNMKNGNPLYQIPVEAKVGPNFEKDKANNPSRVSQYISEATLMVARSDNYKDFHGDFLKLNNGNGYVEHWEGGARYDNHGPDSYQWIDRRYFLARPGVHLLVPVSRKQYLQDMLEYFEIEKANFEYDNAERIKSIGNNTADYAKRNLAALEADKLAYPKIYEAKKAKVNDLLARQTPEWLQKPAVVDQDKLLKDANKILDALGRFYDQEGEYKCALYVLNPAYFVSNNGQSAKPLFMEVQFRYEITKDYGYSSRLFNNWEQHFDINALRKMLE